MGFRITFRLQILRTLYLSISVRPSEELNFLSSGAAFVLVRKQNGHAEAGHSCYFWSACRRLSLGTEPSVDCEPTDPWTGTYVHGKRLGHVHKSRQQVRAWSYSEVEGVVLQESGRSCSYLNTRGRTYSEMKRVSNCYPHRLRYVCETTSITRTN